MVSLSGVSGTLSVTFALSTGIPGILARAKCLGSCHKSAEDERIRRRC